MLSCRCWLQRTTLIIKHARTTSSLAIPSPEAGLHGLSYHWDTLPPTSTQLAHATSFFRTGTPSILYSSSKFHQVRTSSLPEIAFLGRSNAGKSSLLNALMGKQVCHVSSKPGRTRLLNFFAAGGPDPSGKDPGRIVLVDMPGYGKGSRPEWGMEIVKYLSGRRQLRRAFILIDAKVGPKSTDEQILHLLRQHGVPHELVVSKVDQILAPKTKTAWVTAETIVPRLPELERLCEDLRDVVQPDGGLGGLGEIVCTSTEVRTRESGELMGLGELRWAILVAAGLGNVT